MTKALTFGRYVLQRMMGTDNAAIIRKLAPVIRKINEFEQQYQSLSDEQLRGKTAEFRARLEQRRSEILPKVRQLQAERDALDDETRAARADEFHKAIHEEYQRVALTLPRIRKNRRLKRLCENDDRVVERVCVEEMLEELLPEAFAAVKSNSCRRQFGKTWDVCGQPIAWKMIPYDVQLIGGIVMHHGNIAEMVTGEGKTLVATMPAYLNALGGHVHVVTFNDYLARRDAQWNGPMLEALGVRVDYIQTQEMDPDRRREAYAADITYGTSSEFGFDYLRDNMKPSKDLQVQGPLDFGIVDEVDSILIDEARTPLIISGPTSGTTHHYDELKGLVRRLVSEQEKVINRLVSNVEALVDADQLDEAAMELWKVQEGSPKNKRLLKLLQRPGVGKALSQANNAIRTGQQHHGLREDLYYYMEEGRRTVNFTDKAQNEFPELGSLKPPDTLVEADPQDEQAQAAALAAEDKMREWSERMHNISQLIVAYTFYEKDVEYVVMDDKVIIVDEFTGRLMPGRQWSDGLHQAIEAKENVKIREETQTLATITLQNFFRLYKKLAGMTGTAMTEAAEFGKIYDLGVVAIPTNKPLIREDRPDRVYPTFKAKLKAVIDEIAMMHEADRPVLVGTIAVEKSELISKLLLRRGIAHEVLNAKNHEREAHIVAKAGQPGNVTIATNMAGRGTDIVLGPGVAVAGGLHVIGTERHESRRIDNQLRGRAGRQGDPGSTQFYLSLEDDLMRVFAGDWVRNFLARMGFTGDEMIDSPLVARQIGKAQKKVEERNFGQRENVLKYDAVMDEQRWDIYSFRQSILNNEGLKSLIMGMFDTVLRKRLQELAPPVGEPFDTEAVRETLYRRYGIRLLDGDLKGSTVDELAVLAMERLRQTYEQRERFFGSMQMRMIEQYLLLESIDTKWKDHLYAMDALMDAVRLVGYGQKDPQIEYSKGGHELYGQMSEAIPEEVTSMLLRISVAREERPRDIWDVSATSRQSAFAEHDAQRDAAIAGSGREEEKPQPYVNRKPKVGRNDPCPCGSGKKYKKCCGAKEG